jgi:hypothetical protein
MKKSLMSALSLGMFFVLSAQAQDCPSNATIKISSAGYSGSFNVELRRGTRPGSTLVADQAIHGNGNLVFNKVCSGTYFFAFGTPDSDQVSVTQYFKVNFD